MSGRAGGITIELTRREQAGANDVDFRTRSTRLPVPGRVQRLVMHTFWLRLLIVGNRSSQDGCTIEAEYARKGR